MAPLIYNTALVLGGWYQWDAFPLCTHHHIVYHI